MAKQFAKLQRIDNNEAITKETHYDFLYHLQSVILLALLEQGVLDTIQHRHGQEKLNSQRRDRARKKLLEGESK